MRTIQAENEACPNESAKMYQGTGKEVLTVRPQNTIPSKIIDADAEQARHAAGMIRELKHQSRIIEVA